MFENFAASLARDRLLVLIDFFHIEVTLTFPNFLGEMYFQRHLMQKNIYLLVIQLSILAFSIFPSRQQIQGSCCLALQRRQRLRDAGCSSAAPQRIPTVRFCSVIIWGVLTLYLISSSGISLCNRYRAIEETQPGHDINRSCPIKVRRLVIALVSMLDGIIGSMRS